MNVDAVRLQRAGHSGLHDGPATKHLPGTRTQRVVPRLGQLEVARPIFFKTITVKLVTINFKRDDTLDDKVDAL